MPLTTDQQHELLLKNDMGSNGYCPDGFDWAIAYQKVAPLRNAIERTFGGECIEQNPQNIQDKCVYGELFVPEHLSTEKEWVPCIVLCTFGEMVAVSGESALIPGVLEKLKDIFDQMGFQYISESVAKAPYDGRHSAINTWWQRYFDYL